MNMIQKQKKKKEKEQDKKDREDRKEKEEEKEESSEEEPAEPARNSVFGLARDANSKIVINESEESSEEQEAVDELKNHAQKVRSKLNNRTQSEGVSPVSKTKKQSAPPPANNSLPATGNLIGWDPFAPNATSQPQLQNLATRVSKKNKRNKTTSSPVQDPKLMKNMSLPYDPFQTPLTSSNPFNGSSSFPSLMPNNAFNSPSASAPNPFSVPIQQTPINQSSQQTFFQQPPVNNSLGPQSNPSQQLFFPPPTILQTPINNSLGPQSNPSQQLFFPPPSIQQTPLNNSLGSSSPNFFTPQQGPFNIDTSTQVNQQNLQQQLLFQQQLQQQQLQQHQQQLQQQQFQQQQLQQQQGFKDTNPFNVPQGYYGGFQSSSTQGIFRNSNF
jgi:hypothetical protein